MRRRTLRQILERIAEFQARHGQFPSVGSPFLGPGDSWNAIDSALRKDAIVQCREFAELKAALARRGLTPTLARLNPAYQPPRRDKRRFPDILAMVRLSVERHGAFPLRTSAFALPGHRDSWTAIDSALIDGAIADCPLWAAHRGKMEGLGVAPSLASLHPDYRPLRRQQRSIAAIQAQIVAYMAEHTGAMPNQRSQAAGTTVRDSWKAVCKALRSDAVLRDADWAEFHARLRQSGRKPSLFTLVECYRGELQAAHALAAPRQPLSPPARMEKKPVQFAGLISQLFCSIN